MLAAVAALVVGYVPLTGLDHLHLHVDHGLHVFHDHLHIGHHEHDHHHRHPAEPGGSPDDDDSGDEQDRRSVVVSLGHAAQIRPPAVEIANSEAAVVRIPTRSAAVVVEATLHPSWNPRAPPAG